MKIFSGYATLLLIKMKQLNTMGLPRIQVQYYEFYLVIIFGHTILP